jgi:hypothetical protein
MALYRLTSSSAVCEATVNPVIIDSETSSSYFPFL